MRRAIHIFDKDARALWPQILLVLAMTAALAWAQAAASDTALPVLAVAIAIARWYLMACAIHQERPAGDRQFWLTRPYPWRSLVAAKAVFALTWVMIPALAADCAIIVSQGLPLGRAWGTLALRQAEIALVYLLPAAALAAVTDRMGAFLLAGIGMLALVILPPLAAGRDKTVLGPLEWIPTLIAILVAAGVSAVVVVWQYGWRRTGWARTAAGCAVAFAIAMAMSPPAGLAVTLQNRTLPAPPKSADIALRLVRISPSIQPGDLAMEVRVEGLPKGLLAEPDLVRAEADAGKRWNSGWMAKSSGWAWRDGTAEITVKIPAELSHTATVRLRVVITLFRERVAVVKLRGAPVTVPGAGRCALEDGQVVCRSVEPPEDEIRIDDFGLGTDRPPHGLERSRVGESPVWRSSFPLVAWNGEPLTFRLRRPVAHLVRDLVLANVRLGDYF